MLSWPPRHAADDGQRDQAQHIVDQRRRQDGVAHLGLQLAQLLERLHRDAHGGGGEDGADEHRLQEAGVHDHPHAGGEDRQSRAQGQRDEHAQERHQEARLAAVLELLDISPHAGGEHQHDDAQFAELGEELRLAQYVQHGRPQDQSGQQRPYHLGQSGSASSGSPAASCSAGSVPDPSDSDTTSSLLLFVRNRLRLRAIL